MNSIRALTLSTKSSVVSLRVNARWLVFVGSIQIMEESILEWLVVFLSIM
jgi:hypothetical protein